MDLPSRDFALARLRMPLLLTGALLLLCLSPTAAAAAPGPFVDPPAQTTMAPWASANDVAIQASDCGAADSCIATGYFVDSSNSYSPLVVPIIDGSPGAGSEVTVPPGAVTIGHQTNLGSVSCWDGGDCVAAGSYVDSSSQSQALVVPISGGLPAAGSGVTLAGNATASTLSSISCAYAGSCMAVGSYQDTSGNTNALAVAVTGGGSVGAGAEVAPPAGSAASGSQDAELKDVGCWAPGECVAVGFFKDSHGDTQALVVPVTGGVPGAGIAVPLPPDAAVAGSSTVPDAQLAKISCWGAGSCVAVGSYATAGNNIEGLLLPIVGGVPGTAAAAPLPSDAPTAANTQSATLNDISCNSGGECVAVGQYLVSPTDQQALVEPITGGVAGPAQAVWLPAGAGGGIQTATLQWVSCSDTRTCAAAGSFTDVYGQPQELTDSIAAGVAAAGEEPPPFPNESFIYPYTQLSSMSCASSGSCVALGTYANGSGVQVPTVYPMQTPLSIDTTGLPHARAGASYAATLSASGAWGSYSWAISAGALPKGLSLDPQSGRISGITTATGSWGFTVQATAPGVPAQSVTWRSQISVANALRPHVSTSGRSLSVTASRLQVALSCSGSPCSGPVSLQATQVVPVKVRVAYNVKSRVKIRVKPKRKSSGKHRPVYKFRTRLLRRYRTQLEHHHHQVVIGHASYSLTSGGEGSVTVVLTGTGRNLFAHAKAHKLRAWLTVVASGGNRVIQPVTLSRPA